MQWLVLVKEGGGLKPDPMVAHNCMGGKVQQEVFTRDLGVCQGGEHDP